MHLKIYLSSTFEDLKDCREKIYRALRSLRHDVIAMEDYVAADARPVEKCLADVRGSDIYIGLFAWRYGYVPPKNNPEMKSVTELEFREAEKHGKPCLLFILKESALWPASQMDATTGENERGDRIKTLRRMLREERLVAMFESADELASKVAIALYRWQVDSSTAVLEAVPAPPRTRTGRARAREGYTTLWETGSRLRIKFMNGEPLLQSRVVRIARIWSAYANVLFEASADDDAELRVRFDGSSNVTTDWVPGRLSSWSYVGPRCLAVSNKEPTVVLAWLGTKTTLDELEMVVLHQFGRVLGLMHEHNNPDAFIPWNKTAVYRDLCSWAKIDVDRNIFSTWSRELFPVHEAI